jgi:ABC-type uncharacterized transport system permease subunit
MDTTFIVTVSALTAIVVGLTEASKSLGVPSRYAPLVSILLGVLGTLGVAFFEPTAQVILMGLAIGLSASGLYDFSKKTVLGK